MAREMIQFRPTGELTASLEVVAKKANLSKGLASKYLVSLAYHGLDVRYLPMILAMTKADGQEDTFGNCCQHLGSALEGANIVKEIDETERLTIILRAALGYIRQNNDNIAIDACYFSLSKDMERFWRKVKKLAPTC